MRAILTVKMPGGKTTRVQFLGGNDLDAPDRPAGVLTYSFDKRLIDILKTSTIWGKITLPVSRFTLFEGAAVTVFEGGSADGVGAVPGSAPARRRRAGWSPPASRLRPSLAPCSGPSRTSPSGALARVLDRPCARRQFRCAGRDEETAASRTRKQAGPGSEDRRGMTAFDAGRRLPFGGMTGRNFAAGRSRSHSRAL